jgi:hypothetical protein
MADIQTSEVEARLAPVKVGPLNFVSWNSFRGWEISNEITFAKDQKYEHGGQLNVQKLTFCFKKTHEPLHLNK